MQIYDRIKCTSNRFARNFDCFDIDVNCFIAYLNARLIASEFHKSIVNSFCVFCSFYLFSTFQGSVVLVLCIQIVSTFDNDEYTRMRLTRKIDRGFVEARILWNESKLTFTFRWSSYKSIEPKKYVYLIACQKGKKLMVKISKYESQISPPGLIKTNIS